MESYESLKESCNNQEKVLHSRGNNPLYKPVALHLLNSACRSQRGGDKQTSEGIA